MAEIYLPAEDSYLMSKILKKELPRLLKENKELKFLEIGCGSGINLQTALNIGTKKENIFSGDINKKAVEHCKKLGFQCIYSDLFKNINGKYDLIIFNPPYLPEDENEPKNSQLATTGGKTGSEILNKFLKESINYLKKHGKIYIITSSLTKDIDLVNFKKELLGEEKLFQEKLFCLKLER